MQRPMQSPKSAQSECDAQTQCVVQVKQLSRQQSSISQQVITVLQFCSNLLTYLCMLLPFLLQGGFSAFAPTILVIPLATLQGLKVGTKPTWPPCKACCIHAAAVTASTVVNCFTVSGADDRHQQSQRQLKVVHFS